MNNKQLNALTTKLNENTNNSVVMTEKECGIFEVCVYTPNTLLFQTYYNSVEEIKEDTERILSI